MSFYPLKLSLADKTTGLPITTYTQLNLRWSVDSYASAKYSQLAVSGGTYTFGSVGDPIVPGLYKLYDNTTELTAFGVIPIGEPQAVLLTADNTISGDNTFNGENTFNGDVILNDVTFNGDISVTAGNNLTVADAPVNPTEVLRLADLGNYAVLSGGNDFVGNQNFQDGVSFENDPPTCASPPVTGSSLCNQDYIQGIIDSIEVTPAQYSVNEIELMPGGTEQTGKVYTTYANSMQYALATAGVDHRICITVKGMGVAGYNYINISNAGGDYIDDYIHLKGINQDILLIPPATDNVGVSTLGNTFIENFTIYKDDTGVSLLFTNIIFKDIIFDLICSGVTFNNCKFRNCEMKVNDDGDNTATFTNCKGNLTASNQSVGSSTVDANIKPKADF